MGKLYEVAVAVGGKVHAAYRGDRRAKCGMPIPDGIRDGWTDPWSGASPVACSRCVETVDRASVTTCRVSDLDEDKRLEQRWDHEDDVVDRIEGLTSETERLRFALEEIATVASEEQTRAGWKVIRRICKATVGDWSE